MEAPVAERRSWTIEDVLAEFETYSGQVADLGATLQDPPMSETLLPMGDLGTHPMAIMPSTFLFDNYCHLRNDILKPNGPIDRPAAAARREAARADDRVDARRAAVDVRRRSSRSSTGRSRSCSPAPAAARGRSVPAATTAACS